MDCRALVIGIDRYANLPQPLEGCVNDARVITGLLQGSFGFPSSGIVTLLDQDATRERILTELDALVDVAEEGDVVVVTYSGHGSQMTDREGDEPDGMDETIVPHDSGRAPHENRDISDDELYVRLLALSRKTQYVTLIVDCCHSGSVVRDAFGERIRWVEPDRRPAAELPPSTVGPELLTVRREIGPSGWLPLGERYVLIAGCRDDESSYEHTVAQDGLTVVHGALTYFLVREIARAGPGTTYRDVFEAAGAQVTAAKPRQHPQMEGAADRELFGLREIVPVRFAGVVSREDTAVSLQVGLAHGVTPGSRWAIHPPGTKDVGEDAVPCGLVEITAVRATGSDAAVIEETTPGAVAEGCRAVEVSHAEAETRLRVQVAAPAHRAASLLALVEGSGLLRRAGDGEPADARVYLIPSRGEVDAEVPVPQLGAVREPTWAVVGADGLLMMPPHVAGASDGRGEHAVLSNLETAARYRHALSLSEPSGALRGKVDLVLKRRSGDGDWIEAQPDPASGRVIYEEGERVALEINNRHAEPVYVSVLDFGLAGSVGLLYPIAGASEPLAPGRSISVGVREGDELELRFPQGLRAAADPSDGMPAEGTETFKLIATTSPADLRPLLQGGFRDVARPARPAAGDAWVTVERSFTLRRAGG